MSCPKKLMCQTYTKNKAELLHSLLVVMVTVLPQQQHYSLTHIVTKNICAKYELRIHSCVELVHNSFVAMVTVITIGTR